MSSKPLPITVVNDLRSLRTQLVLAQEHIRGLLQGQGLGTLVGDLLARVEAILADQGVKLSAVATEEEPAGPLFAGSHVEQESSTGIPVRNPAPVPLSEDRVKEATAPRTDGCPRCEGGLVPDHLDPTGMICTYCCTEVPGSAAPPEHPGQWPWVDGAVFEENPTWDAPCTFVVLLEDSRPVLVRYEGRDGPLGPNALRLEGPVSSAGFVSHTPRRGAEPIEGESLRSYAGRCVRHHATEWVKQQAKAGPKTRKGKKARTT